MAGSPYIGDLLCMPVDQHHGIAHRRGRETGSWGSTGGRAAAGEPSDRACTSPDKSWCGVDGGPNGYEKFGYADSLPGRRHTARSHLNNHSLLTSALTRRLGDEVVAQEADTSGLSSSVRYLEGPMR